MSERKLGPWKRLATDDGGSQIAEAALVLPIVFTLLFAILSFARAYNIYTTITYAAQEGARVANTSTCATCLNTASTATDVANRVSAVLQASSINPTQIQAYASPGTLNACPGTVVNCPPAVNKVQTCTNVEMNANGGALTGPAACGAVVTFEYPFGFQIPFFSQSGQTILLKADVQMPTEE